MKISIIVFPASNCDRDAAVAVRQVIGAAPQMVWHGDAELPPSDVIILPGGFSYGDYLRSGAMASRSPVMKAVVAQAKAGVRVIGVCNGFQMLTETGLLPGALLRNAGINFVCRPVTLRVENAQTPFTSGYEVGQHIDYPVAHHDGNYFADDETLDRLEGDGRVVFRYVDNPNGSARDIAGIVNAEGNVLGLMPHPERAVSPLLAGIDGVKFFESALSVS